jgi:hypothetical protein
MPPLSHAYYAMPLITFSLRHAYAIAADTAVIITR